MKKIGALIPIRLASERLPCKAMKEVKGRPLVYYLLEQICASRYIDKTRIVVCTTTDKTDDLLVEKIRAYGANIFRGERDDIIKRFYEAMNQFDFDIMLQVDGDDILADPHYMDLTIEALLADPSLDIALCEGLPLGVASKSFTRNALHKVYQRYQTIKNDTGFIYFFTKTGICKKKLISPLFKEHICDDLRLTLDYQEDFEVFKRMIEALYQPEQSIHLEKIITYIKGHPEVIKINQFLNEIYWQRTSEKSKLQFIDANGEIKQIGMRE